MTRILARQDVVRVVVSTSQLDYSRQVGGSPSVRQTIGRVASHSASDSRLAPRIGVSPARAGKHVAPVNGGLQMTEHTEGVGPEYRPGRLSARRNAATPCR
jgi:hypothetical protein